MQAKMVVNKMSVVALTFLLSSCAYQFGGGVSSESTHKSDVSRLLLQAYNYATDRKDSEAEQLLLQAQKLEPANPWVALNLGAIYQRNGHKELALKQYQVVLASSESETAAQISDPSIGSANPAAIANSNIKKLDLWAPSRTRVPLVVTEKKTFSETPVELAMQTELKKTVSNEVIDSRSELQAFLESWRISWETLDFDSYVEHYQPTFMGDRKTRNRWIASRKAAFARNASNLKINIFEPVFKISEHEVEISFKQDFKSAVHKDSGTKVLKLVKSEGRWVIYKESFSNKNW